MTDLPFLEAAPDPTAIERPPRKCRRHQWVARRSDGVIACSRCGALRNADVSRRGRNNRSRGNAIERQVAAQLGLRRVGQFGGPDDIRGLAFAGQVKSGAAFSEKLWRWLKAVPVTAGETAIVVLTDAPGPGHPRRAMVVLDLADWRALHGPEGGTA